MHQVDLQPFDEVEIGRKLGYDFFRFGRTFEAATMHPVMAEGFLLAKAQNIRQLVPDRFTRKWLQLRQSAYGRRRYFDEQVTPDLIKTIDVPLCPVMRVTLTHGELSGTDWSIDRLNNDGAYAPSNLAVIGTMANQAKGRYSFEEVYARSQESNLTGFVEGLTSEQWLRLAAMMLGPCFAKKPGSAPIIPLVAPIPKYTVRQVIQQVQYSFTIMAARPAGKNALIKSFDTASSGERCKIRLRFLAEAVHLGLKGLEYPWDVWLKPNVMLRLEEWRACMNDAAWGIAGDISMRLAGGRRVSPQRLDAWYLERRGYL